MMKRILILSAGVLLLAVTSRADIYGFTDVTTNSSYRAAVAGQLRMETTVVNAGTSSVQFTNIGSLDSTIATIYFGSDDTALYINIESIISCSPGVDFDINAKPADPPASGDFGSWWYITLANTGANPPPAQNGIDPGECLELEISYSGTSSFSEMIQFNELQVALHVISLPDGLSDTFVNNTYVVPEPASLVLIGSAGAFIGFIRRRFTA